MIFFSNLLSLPAIILKVVNDVWKQKRFINKSIQPILNDYKTSNDGTLDEEDFKKITSYYGFGVPAVLAESYAALRGKKLTKEERLASTCQGAATGLFDDMFDKKHLPKVRIKALLDHPETIQADNSFEKMFLFFYTEFLKHVTNTSLLQETISNIHASQEDSLEQTNERLAFDTMLHTTFKKGGSSVLFYRALMAPAVSSKEKEALFEMGALMQMGNDIFDVYKDSRDGIKTIMNSNVHIAEVRSIFTRQMDKAFKLFMQTEYTLRRKTKVLRTISFGISRVFVALDQYQKLGEREGDFEPLKYTRKELICDMEKPLNLWHSASYYLKYPIG